MVFSATALALSHFSYWNRCAMKRTLYAISKNNNDRDDGHTQCTSIDHDPHCRGVYCEKEMEIDHPLK